ncbi:MAG: hypothetical protein H0T15_00530 [Thermoleophilaceae bacterium]|nr:hypothetical protein [Thermoleophilaceae bacterium]
MALAILDLTAYEVGNALMRGRIGLEAKRVASPSEIVGDLPTAAGS